MKTLKKVWLTEHGDEIWSLTLESKSLVPHEKLKYSAMEFPSRAPNRHTVVLDLLGLDDLYLLQDAIHSITDQYE